VQSAIPIAVVMTRIEPARADGFDGLYSTEPARGGAAPAGHSELAVS